MQITQFVKQYRRHCYILCFILLSVVGSVQQTKAQYSLDTKSYSDSLKNVLATSKQDTMLAMANFALADYYLRVDTNISKKYLASARNHIGSNHFLEALYNMYEANTIQLVNDSLAEISYQKADAILAGMNSKNAFKYRSLLWGSYGIIKQKREDYKSYVEIITNKCMLYAGKAGDSVSIGNCYFMLGVVYKNNAQMKIAEESFLKAIAIFKNNGKPAVPLVKTYQALAEAFALQNKNKLARQTLDSAKMLLNKYPESEYNLNYYAAESMCYTIDSNFNASLASADKGIALARYLNLKREEVRLQLQKFYAYYNSKRYTQAVQVLQYLQKQPEYMYSATNKLQLFYGYAAAYKELGNFKNAFTNLEIYTALSDSINQAKLYKDINALELKFKTAENQQKITELQAEKDKVALRSKNATLLIWILAGSCIFLLVLALLTMKYLNNNKKLAAQTELNYQQQLNEQAQQQEIKFTQALLEGEERERKRLAGDLHDGLGGMLAGVKINLSQMNQSQEKQLDAGLGLTKVIDQLDQSVHELRRIARNMMPESLLKMGLETALKDLCESYITPITRVEFQAFEIKPNLPEQIQMHIYRIVQELITNAHKHADATFIFVQCSQNENTFFITVEDNGKGFHVHETDITKGIGIANVKNRVDYLRGTLDIKSTINKGTVLNIELNVTA
jgi:two-component system, NarL family, sensor kinase